MKIVPGGEITYIKKPGERNDFIGELLPQERIKEKNNNWEVAGEPIYFNLRPPRSFQEAEVFLDYENPDNLSMIELGVLADGKLWRYKTKPVENRQLDLLAKDWELMQGKDLIFLQKEKK